LAPIDGGSAGAVAPKLEARGICKTFVQEANGSRRETEVLQNIDLRVEAGEFVSFLGASGCGKTTFLRMVDGLVPPSAGEILLSGKPVTMPGPDRAFVFQDDSLLPWRTVQGNVMLGLEAQRVRREDAMRRAREQIDLVGLQDFTAFYPHELSGGMRQRVNLARALAIDPEVLLMDEPFASLDSQTREVMQSELLRIWSAKQKTVLFVTHQIEEAVYLSNRIVVLSSRPGRVKEIVDVELPRPRTISVKRTAAFTAKVEHIWGLIEKDVRRGALDGQPHLGA
jgi:NitT/TauT family transport system ATP-binding protein